PTERLHVAGNIRADGMGGTGVRLVVANANGTLDANTNVSGLITSQIDTVLSKDITFITGLTTNPTFIANVRSMQDTTLAWSLTGSSGTDPTRNFLGTSDNQPLAIRTGNVERVRIAAGSGFVGLCTAPPTERLHVAGNIRADGMGG